MRSPTRAWPRSNVCGSLPRELTASRLFAPPYWTGGSKQQLIFRWPPDRPGFSCSPARVGPRRRHRRRGDPPLQAPAVRPRRPGAASRRRRAAPPARAGARPPILPIADKIAEPPPLPPLTPLERREFDYSDLNHWMVQMDQAIRRTRRVLGDMARSMMPGSATH